MPVLRVLRGALDRVHPRLAALDPDLVIYQRQVLGLSTEELEQGWAQLIESICGGR